MTRDEAEKHYRRLYRAKAYLWEAENYGYGCPENVACHLFHEWVDVNVADAVLAWEDREWNRARWEETSRERELQRLRDDTLVRMQQMVAEMTKMEDTIDHYRKLYLEAVNVLCRVYAEDPDKVYLPHIISDIERVLVKAPK
jgi:hypothetical protein